MTILPKSIPSKAFLLLALLAIILLLNTNRVSLWDQDESAYAGFALNIVETGNWVMPDFTWSDVHRKPPLHFWNIAISYKFFGVNEFAVRFPSTLFVLLTLALVFWGGRKIFGERQSLYGMMVLGTTLLVPSLAKISVTDATLLFFTTLCAMAILHVLLFGKRIWVLVFWVSFSMALLTKGPPVILFAGGFGLILLLLHPKRKNLIMFHPWFFFPLSLLPLLVWIHACMQEPQGKVFVEWMLDWYILKRIGGSVFGQTGPPGTHLLLIMAFFIPYLMFLPGALVQMAKNLFSSEKGNAFLLASWFVAGWFIFELSPSKLPAYVVVAHVPLAIVIGKHLAAAKIPSNLLKSLHLTVWLLVGVSIIVGAVLLELPPRAKVSFIIAAIVLLVALLPAFYYKKKGFGFPKNLIAYNLLFQGLVWVFLLPALEPLKNSTLEVAKTAESLGERGTKIILANDFSMPPSLPFYLKLRFDEVVEEYDHDKLLEIHEKQGKVLFVLNEEQKGYLEQNIGKLEFFRIEATYTDRVAKGVYYLLVKGD